MGILSKEGAFLRKMPTPRKSFSTVVESAIVVKTSTDLLDPIFLEKKTNLLDFSLYKHID